MSIDNTMRLTSSSLISLGQYVVMVIFLASSATLLHAQTKTFSGTGNWSNAANWSPSGVPTSTNAVIIASGASVTVDGNYTCDSIYFAAGSSGSIITVSSTNKLTATRGILFSNPTAKVTQLINLGAGTLECGSLTLPNISTNRVNRINISTGTIIVNKDFTSAGSTSENIVEFSGAGEFKLGGSWVSSSGTFTNSTSSFEYFSNTSQTIRSRTYNKLILTGATKTPSGSIICQDSLVINAGATLNNSGSASLTLNNVFYIAGTYIEGSTSGSVTLIGLVHIAATGTFQATVGEAFTIRGGLKNEGNFISGTGTYTFATNDQTLSGLKMFTFQGNLTVTGITLTSEDSVRVNGSFTGNGTYVNSSYLLLMGTSFSISNLDLNNAGNVVEYGRAGTQTIRALTYENLRISGAATKTAGGNLNVNASLYVGAASTLSMSTFILSTDPSCQISGTGNFTTANVSSTPVTADMAWTFTNFTYNSSSSQRIIAGSYVNLISINATRTLQNSGIIKISGVFTPGTGTYTRTGSTIEFNGSGSQTIPLFTYNNLISSNTGARTLPGGTITVQGNFTAGPNSYTVTGNTMVFSTATQSLSGTFNNVTLSTAGTKTANGNINVAGTLSIAASVTLDLTTNYILSGTLTTISNSGTIKTAVPTTTSNTPIAAGKTWNGTVEYYGNAQQTAVSGTYTNLSASGSGIKQASGDITVTGNLNLGPNPTANQGILEMTSSYGSYANVNNVDNTSIYNNLNSFILVMGASSNTTGSGDVTGKIRRTSIASGTTYTFGNPNTQLTFTGTSLPTQITVVATRGTEGTHVDKSNSVRRLYQVLRTGGNTPTTMNIRLAYEDGDLNGNTETNLVLWDHHLPYGGLTPHEHGKTNQNTGQNWVELSSHGILYLAAENDPAFTKYWMISNKVSVDTTWLGAVNGGSWNIPSNWNAGVVPASNAKIVVPDAATTPNDPTISGTVTVGTMEIKAGGVVNGGSGTLTLTGGPAINGGAGTWLNNGTFNAGTGTVVIDNADGTIAGTTTFNNLTINNARKATIQSGSSITINGTLTNSGTLDAASNPNTITFPNAGQNIVNPNGTVPGYSSLVLNGATPTIPTTLDISGDLTLNTAVTFTGNTTRFRGASAQAINGTNAPTFNNVIINNNAEVSTQNNTTINGTLTFTTGKLNINNTTLTLAGGVVNTVGEGIKSAGNANLVLNGNNARTINFDQSEPNLTNKINTLTNNSSAQTTTIGSKLLITNAIIPTSGTINANGNLVLVSDNTSTARIAQGTGSYITGNVTVQRYIPESARRWRFLSSAATNATIEDLRNETFITGPGTGNTIGATNSNGYDATQSNAAGIYWYDETLTTGDINTGWTIPTNTSHVLAPGKGYRVFVRGDRSDINRITNVNLTQNQVTLDVNGPVNSGDITMPISFSSSGNVNNDGWNLIGNPYPSAFDWNAFHDAGRSGNSGTNYTNIEPTIWVLDPNDNTYKFYNALSNAGNITNGVVAQGQGFWVKATGSGAAITFKEAFKTTSTPTNLFKNTEGGAFKIRVSKDSLNADELLVKYISGSTKMFDAYDVYKLSSPIVISSYGTDNVHLSLSARPLSTTQNDTIKLYLYAATSGNYNMQFSNSNSIAVQDQILLIDNFTNTVTDLKNTSNYSFTVATNNAASFGLNRFYIVVANNSQLPVKLMGFNAQKTAQKQVALTWSTAQEKNSNKFEIQHSTDGYHFNTIGWVDAKGNSNALTTYKYLHTNPNEVNYYRLKQVDNNLSFEYSSIVKVDFTTEDAELPEAVSMYPIPAINDVTLALTNKHEIAAISIYNLDGKLIHTKTTQSAVVKLDLSNYASGVYLIQLEDEFGEIITHKFTKD